MDDTRGASPDASSDAPGLTRPQARRLREIYRSAGWPSQDSIEIELLAIGMLERIAQAGGCERLRLTDRGIRSLAQALQRNRQSLSAHDALVASVAQSLLREGRVVWTGLSIRARLQGAGADVAARQIDLPDAAMASGGSEANVLIAAEQSFELGADPAQVAAARWKVCKPDVFSIRNTTVAGYLEPVVHEIKVSRADLLGDLRLRDKRDAYLDLGGQCWYVLGVDARGLPIAQAHEVPDTCGVMVALPDARCEVLRHAPRRAIADLPFALWMVLAKATPLPAAWADMGDDGPCQQLLAEPPARSE